MDAMTEKIMAAIAVIEKDLIAQTCILAMMRTLLKDHKEGRVNWTSESRAALDKILEGNKRVS